MPQKTKTSKAAKTPIFILGSPRSGTTIITQALIKGANIAGYQEGHLLPLIYYLNKEIDLYYEQKNSSEKEKRNIMLDNISREKIKKRIINSFHNLVDSLHEGDMWLDKTPGDKMILIAPYLKESWQKSKFIFAKRRGIECIISRTKKFPNVPFEAHCRLWLKAMDSWSTIKPNLEGSYLEIDQRQIALTPEQVAQKIGDFLDFSSEQIGQIEYIFKNKRPQHTGGKEEELAIDIKDTGWSDQQINFFLKKCEKINETYGYSNSSSYYV